MSQYEHSQYDNNQASVLVVSPLEYIRTQQFECLKRLRAHSLHIDLALLVKLPLMITPHDGNSFHHIAHRALNFNFCLVKFCMHTDKSLLKPPV